jgi:hypothetical protein
VCVCVCVCADTMLNLLGLQFPGWNGEGLKISYDKDDSEQKRQERKERKIKDEAHKMCVCVPVYLSVCLWLCLFVCVSVCVCSKKRSFTRACTCV